MVPSHSLKWNSIAIILLPTLTFQWIGQSYHRQLVGSIQKMPTAICRDIKDMLEGSRIAFSLSSVCPLFNSLVFKEWTSKAKLKCLNKEYIPVSEIPNICMASSIWHCCMSQDCAQSLFLRILGVFCITLFLLLSPQLHSMSTPCVRGRSEEQVRRSQAPCYYSFSFRNSKGEILALLQ